MPIAYAPGAQYAQTEMDDVNGGVGDELDSISLRDVAAVRFVRHHEWLEHVVGTGVPTYKIEPPKILLPDEGSAWSFGDTESLSTRLKKIEAEVEQLEKEKTNGWGIEDAADTKSSYIWRMSGKLRDEFGQGGSDEGAVDKMIQDLEAQFGTTIVEKKRVRRVGAFVDESAPAKKEEQKPSKDIPAEVGDSAGPELIPEAESREVEEPVDLPTDDLHVDELPVLDDDMNNEHASQFTDSMTNMVDDIYMEDSGIDF